MIEAVQAVVGTCCGKKYRDFCGPGTLSIASISVFESRQNEHASLPNSETEAPVILKLWGMRSTPSLPSLPGPP